MSLQALQKAAKKMLVDFEEITSQIAHNGEKGTSREEILRKYLINFIPEKYKIGRGIIIDSNGIQSKQQDIIIYDSFFNPVLLNFDSVKMIPIENVYATIEVKSSLNKIELKKSINNIKSVRSLIKCPIYEGASDTIGIIFSFTSETSLESLLTNLVEENKDIPVEQQISYICVLDKGLIVNVNKFGLSNVVIIPDQNSTAAIISNQPENNLMIFYLLLIQFLNQARVIPPNLVKYAHNQGLINVNWFIPKEFLPLDGFISVNGKRINLKEPVELMDDFGRFEKILAGGATFEEFISYFADNFRKIMSVSQSAIGGKVKNMNIYGKDYSVDILYDVFDFYKGNKRQYNSDKQERFVILAEDIYNQYCLYYKERDHTSPNSTITASGRG